MRENIPGGIAMKKDLKDFRAVVKSCYDWGYKIAETSVIIDEDTTRGFETKDHIILMYSRATKEDFTDCIEIFSKKDEKGNPLKKLSEGKMLDTYSRVAVECLRYDIDIAKNLSDIDTGTVRGFESMSYIVIIYKKLTGDKNTDYISFLEKTPSDDNPMGKIIEGRKLGTSKAIVEECARYNIDITKERLFLEEHSTRGIDFGDYIILRYREVTKDDYINVASVGLIDKKEGRIYSMHSSALMIDDKLSDMWKFFSKMEKLENWEAEVLKEYKGVTIEGNKMTVEGKGKFVVEIEEK